MIRSMNPHRTAAFNRSVILVPLDPLTPEELRRRQVAEIMDSFDSEDPIAAARGILGALALTVCAAAIGYFFWVVM